MGGIGGNEASVVNFFFPEITPGNLKNRPGPGTRTPATRRVAARGDPVPCARMATPGHWLLKTEPSSYAFADLRRDGVTRWDGITNNAALLHLRTAARGDLVVIYHTGTEKAAVGLATIVRAAYPDPGADDPTRLAVDVRVGDALAQPVALATLRRERLFAASPLVKQSRLSFLPLTDAQYRRILELGRR